MERKTNSQLISIISVIMGLISLYPFYKNVLSIESLILIGGGLIVVILISTVQDKTSSLEEIVSKLLVEQKRLKEKLKIHEQLVDIKSDINTLKNVKKK